MFPKVKEFLKAQVSAFVGGLVDYGIMLFCKEVLDFTISTSIVISGGIGAIVNFTINRFWTFKKEEVPVVNQLWKFILVVVGSIMLKSQGTPLLSSLTGIDYRITRLIVEVIVSLGFNFTLQKYWVFKKNAP